jgi:acyl-ACP thioesterase
MSTSASASLSDKLVLETVVSYRDVDREEVLQLPAAFQLLQEAAIAHANRHDVGTRAVATSGESWVLNRIAVRIHRYARYEEPLRIETWSSGIRSFKGHRDFRVFDRAGELVIAGSSLWLYVSLATKSIVRVPREVAERFPARTENVFCPELETLAFPAAGSVDAKTIPVSVRYGDIDANGHVNNAIYLDYLQTALAQAGRPARPGEVRLKFGKGIPSGADTVTVRIASVVATGTAFAIEHAGAIAAEGLIAP